MFKDHLSICPGKKRKLNLVMLISNDVDLNSFLIIKQFLGSFYNLYLVVSNIHPELLIFFSKIVPNFVSSNLEF